MVLPEPVLHRKATFVQTSSGHTDTFMITSESSKEIASAPSIVSCDIIDEDEEAPVVINTVDQSKRQAYLNNRKGTFAANSTGKMVAITLNAGDEIMGNVGADIGVLVEDDEHDDADNGVSNLR